MSQGLKFFSQLDGRLRLQKKTPHPPTKDQTRGRFQARLLHSSILAVIWRFSGDLKILLIAQPQPVLAVVDFTPQACTDRRVVYLSVGRAMILSQTEMQRNGDGL
jgi:hypothetical protein